MVQQGAIQKDLPTGLPNATAGMIATGKGAALPAALPRGKTFSLNGSTADGKDPDQAAD